MLLVGAGEVTRDAVLPRPSRPWPLYPQHDMLPAGVRAQDEAFPSEITAQGPLSTRTGMLRCVVVPSPSWAQLL